MSDEAQGAQHPVRIPPLPREEWTDEAREVFAFWGEPNGRENGSKSNLVMVLAHHPQLAQAYFAFGKHLLVDSSLPMRPRELVVLRTAWLLKALYEWHYHVGYAVNMGMTLDEIANIKTGPSATEWNDEDRTILLAVDELYFKSGLSDESWAALSRYYDKQQIMDLVFTVGNYVTISWAISAMGIQLEDGVDVVGFDLKTRSGAPPVKPYRPGEADGEGAG